MKYFIERQTPNGAWVSEGGCGPGFEFDSAVFFMTKKHHFWSEDVFRVIDEHGAVVPHTASAEDRSESEVKEGTPTMTYTIQWQDKDGKWYVDEEGFSDASYAFLRMCALDSGDCAGDVGATRPRRIVAEDDTPLAYGRHRPISASERPKQKLFWIVTEGKPSERYGTMAQACMAARHTWSGDPRYVLQAVCEINCVETEIGE